MRHYLGSRQRPEDSSTNPISSSNYGHVFTSGFETEPNLCQHENFFLPFLRSAIIIRRAFYCGQVSEWSNEHDWKSCVPLKGTEGSNPSLSAINFLLQYIRNECIAVFVCRGVGQSRTNYYFKERRSSHHDVPG